MTKELTIEDFNKKSVCSSLKGWGKDEILNFAMFSTELLVNSYPIKDDAPKKAFQAAKNWQENPTEENKIRCQEAADFDIDANDVAADYADAASCRAALATSAAARAVAHASHATHVVFDAVINPVNDKLDAVLKSLAVKHNNNTDNDDYRNDLDAALDDHINNLASNLAVASDAASDDVVACGLTTYYAMSDVFYAINCAVDAGNFELTQKIIDYINDKNSASKQ